MSMDLHDMDESFKSAYRQSADEPSPDVWDKINAGLNKRDAESHKKKSRKWKTTAILSLLLLMGFLLYETGVLKTRFGHSKENVSIAQTGRRIERSSEKRNETISNRDKSFPSRSKKEELRIVKGKSSGKTEGNTGTVAFLNKNIHPAVLRKTKKNRTAMASHISTSKKELQRKDQYATTGPITVLSVEEHDINNVIARHLDHSEPTFLNIINDSASINNKSETPAAKHIDYFKPQWTIGGYLSADFAGYRLDKDQPTILEIKKHEEHQPSFSEGILIARQFKRRWSLQSGLIYSNTSIAISPQKIYASQSQAGGVSYKYITSSGFAYISPGFSQQPSPGDSLTAESAQHSLQHIIVPLLIHYSITKHNKLIFSPGFGIMANFLTSAKLETEVGDSYNREHVLINKLDAIRSVYWSAMADAEVQYLLTRKISIDLHPSFRYALSPLTDNDNVSTFPYGFGLGLGVTYRF